MRCCGNGEYWVALLFSPGFEGRPAFLRLRQVHLIEDDDLRARCQLLIVFAQFFVDVLEVLPGVAFERCAIKYVQQQTGALHMT